MSIILDHVSYIYGEDGPLAVKALDDVSLQIPDGQFVGIIGHTGSGKSTLIQHMNGLLKATSGHIYFNGEDIYDRDFPMKKLRSRVGLVFQYPEHQLFETTIFKDVCFGPKNQGLSQKDAELKAFEALRAVGLPKELWYQSPFDLSGGQKRRVAIAGVLAMQPEVLILDEYVLDAAPAVWAWVFSPLLLAGYALLGEEKSDAPRNKAETLLEQGSTLGVMIAVWLTLIVGAVLFMATVGLLLSLIVGGLISTRNGLLDYGGIKGLLLGLLALDRGFLLRLVLLLPILLSALGLASAGALLGGVLLGMIEIFASAYLSSELSLAIVFGVLIVVLLVKPSGLLGRYVPEKV